MAHDAAIAHRTIAKGYWRIDKTWSLLLFRHLMPEEPVKVKRCKWAVPQRQDAQRNAQAHRLGLEDH